MYLIFGALFIAILIILVLKKEDFFVRYPFKRRWNQRARTLPYQRRLNRPIQRLWNQPIRQNPFRRIAPQSSQRRGFPLGPAVANPYQTGVVRGSLLAPLQMQYRQIFTPRNTATVGTGASRVSMVSGQPQMRQHLQPGGLGHTGWVYRRP